jgi:hypothetical protein
VELKKDQNATTTLLVSNATSGTAGAATLQLGANANSVKLQALSSTFTTSNAAIADGVLLESASTASGGLHLSAASTNELALWTNDTRRVTITSAGCVGIGTATTSSVIFKIQGDGCTTGTFYANAFSGGGVTDNVWIMNGQDAYFKELSAGDNIGIGTTTPAHTLHVGGNAVSAAALLVCDSGGQRIEVTSAAVKINNAYTLPAADGTAGQVICTDGADTLTFGPGGYWTCISGPEIYYATNVGIGTDNPSARLDVQGGGVIFNDAGGDYDVRMEGDAEANLFMLDASVDRIGIGTATPSHLLDVEGVANFATCIVTVDVCATNDVIATRCVSATQRIVTIADVCAAQCVVAGACVTTPQICGTTQITGATVCASSALTVAAGTVAGAPSGTNDITSKCYVDAEIAAAGKGVKAICCVCCSQSTTVTIPSGVSRITVTATAAGGDGGVGNSNTGGGGGGAGASVLNHEFPLTSPAGCSIMFCTGDSLVCVCISGLTTPLLQLYCGQDGRDGASGGGGGQSPGGGHGGSGVWDQACPQPIAGLPNTGGGQSAGMGGGSGAGGGGGSSVFGSGGNGGDYNVSGSNAGGPGGGGGGSGCCNAAGKTAGTGGKALLIYTLWE